jgi:drug/metabolite transporter (DMT)-like permease
LRAHQNSGAALFSEPISGARISAALPAILLSSETLFAAISGAIYLGERLNATQMAGCALIFACILAVQLLPYLERGKDVPAN